MQEDVLSAVFDAMPFLMFYKDTRNNIIRVNRTVADSFGVTPDDMADTPTSRWYPDEAEDYYADDLEVIQTGRPKLGIVEQVVVNGEKRWVRTDKFPTRAADGSIDGVVLLAHDITESKRLAEQLERSQRMESVGRLAGGIAHDFNNLLTAIRGFAALARRDAEHGKNLAEYLALIEESCDRAGRLNQALLGFARRQISRPRPTDLDQLLIGWLGMLRRVLPENIAIDTRFGSGRPVLVDPGQIEQVVLNLVLNARDAMRGGGRLTITTSPAGTGSEAQVRLEIRDNGCGMGPELASRIFEPFFSTRPGGAGLGLSMCFGILEQHHGSIRVESEPGEGTSFEVLLPAAGSAPAPAIETPVRRAEAARGGETVLIVEDEPRVRRVTESLLLAAGYTVESTGDSRRALEVTGPFDLLLTDVVMPEVSGYELAEHLTRRGVVRKVLLMTGHSQEALERTQDGGEDWPLLTKPFGPFEIAEAVRQALES